jgi:hypothetical protein
MRIAKNSDIPGSAATSVICAATGAHTSSRLQAHLPSFFQYLPTTIFPFFAS